MSNVVAVGSGLILLVIVGAWLAVLVPMALRSHDNSTSLRSTDRFSDAMRVLSRRSARDVLVPRRSHSSLVISETKSARRAPTATEDAQVDDEVEHHVPRTAAERRLRTLMVLVGLALVTLGLALYGIRLALVVHGLCDLLLVLFVVHLRRQAIVRAQRVARAARVARATGASRPASPVRKAPRIAGIPDRMPMRPAALTQPLPAPATRYEDKPTAAAAAIDDSWSPVPVPPPTYVGKAVAPKRQPRVLDLTKPGAWTATLEGEDAGLDILDDGSVLEDIIERRRAVNGW
ncbi:MAG: hypothetical protein JWO12_149 [Frankiales bacterium]|nr:hypothetical protein [Frankiales bacterium]